MPSSILADKSFSFAVRIVNVYKELKRRGCDITLARQILKAGTSIGANVCEARNGQSENDFIHKLSISQKEGSETDYWIRLLYATGYLNEKESKSLTSNVSELNRMIRSTILTKKQKRRLLKSS
jgi:four helix bundle protein